MRGAALKKVPLRSSPSHTTSIGKAAISSASLGIDQGEDDHTEPAVSFSRALPSSHMFFSS
ncbi:hypothetical protein JZ751_022411 [Albula glossodonta]|uniref:Uncharacterized protein n=1 Tax=Albula glossodonta TaxID=121402 RepID=A0A8T2MYF4_9TELE|nr:hypothetical protein JZ751_022411 [Albula glossodonta]